MTGVFSSVTARPTSTASGLSVITAKVEDVYDEFNYGIFNPQAIRDFLSHAYDNWSPAPSYVLLLGDATYDFKDNLGKGIANAVPSQLVETPSYGETASDYYFVAVDGSDVLPDMFIGRLPVASAAEAATVVQKIINYEESPVPGSWNMRHVFTIDYDDDDGVDDPDDGGFFEMIVEGVYGHAVIAKENIARVLAEKVDEGSYTMDEAKKYVRWLLRENPERLFFPKGL